MLLSKSRIREDESKPSSDHRSHATLLYRREPSECSEILEAPRCEREPCGGLQVDSEICWIDGKVSRQNHAQSLGHLESRRTIREIQGQHEIRFRLDGRRNKILVSS